MMLQLDFSCLLKLVQIFDQDLDGNITLEEFAAIQLSGEVETPRKVLACIAYDPRADINIKQRLDEFGEEEEDELRLALLSLKHYLDSEFQGNSEAFFRRLDQDDS